MEANVLYPLYYRRHGVVRAVQLVAPTLSPMETLDLPRESILHFVSDDESLYGIPSDDLILRNAQGLVMVEHIQELSFTDRGPARPTRLPASPMIREYHRKYRKTRMLPKLDTALRNPQTVIVENYALLPHLYRYTTSYFRSYFKWWNIQATMWKRVGEIAKVSDRQQYLQCRLPKVLPSPMLLRKAENNVGMSRNLLPAFSEPETLFILELWKWLGPHREQSVLNLTPAAQLANMNLIWSESGRWFMMNLGRLDEWRKGSGSANAVIEPELLQKRFLRLLMFLYETRTVAQDASGGSAVQKMQIETQEPPKNDLAVTREPVATVVAKPVVLTVPETAESVAQKLKIAPGLNIDALPDQAIEETEANILAIDVAISRDLDALDHLFAEQTRNDVEVTEVEPTPRVAGTPTIKYVPAERSLENGIMVKADMLADAGQLSGAEYRRFQAISTAYTRLPDPYGKEDRLSTRMTINPMQLKLSDDVQIPDIDSVFDKSMLKSTLFEFDRRYIKEILRSDITRSVVSLQHGGIGVTGYSVVENEDAMNAYESHTVELSPVQGKSSTVHFRIPKVNEDGTFKSSGVRYRLRKQRGDVPIRKVSSSRVALTSYYSRVFVSRSEKVVHNYAQWLTNQIASMGMDPENPAVTQLMMSNVFDSSFRTPRIYSTMAMRFRSFTIGEKEFFFDYGARYAQFGEEAVKAAEVNGLTVIGRQGKDLMVVDNNDALYLLRGSEPEPAGTLESLVSLTGRMPIETAEVKIFKKHIPVGLVLAYHLGLTQLMTLLQVKPRRVPNGERLHLSDDEYVLRFEDESLVFNRDNRVATQILSGLITFEQSTRNYPIHLFDRKDIYLNVLEQSSIGVRYLREIDLMIDLFVDPITEEILISMGEPTDVVGLLIRSCELLMTDWAPAETDMAYMRIKGYERIAGAVYAEMIRVIRVQRARGAISNAKIELPPYAVWQAVQQDAAVKLVEESNPVHQLKEIEEVTYSGTGGRSARSMVRRTRVFHENDMGVISEATKDSADVAITTFLTADPNLTDLRGMTKRYELGKTGPTSLLSTSALLAPSADRDDPKRVNFISIQQSAGTFARGYRPTPLRTGYEQILAHRTDDLYAFTAKAEGTVTSVTAKAVTVSYSDGTSKTVELGRRYGTASGSVFPHTVKSAVTVGDVVKEGEVIAYNTHYFEPDALDPKQVVWKAGVLVATAIAESVDTLEDSSAISERTAQLLETDLTKIRDITVTFDQSIHNLVAPGSAVDVESILCTIEDAITAQNNLFDNDSRDTLRLLSANTPRAKFKGTVEKIEVFYNGDVDDMSPALQELATESDRNRKREARDLKTTYTSGRVDETMRIDGNPLLFETAVIRVYVTGPVSAGVGDKGVLGNQLKTIFGRVMAGENTTESGRPIDAIFGYKSISDRIVRSPEIAGTTNTLLRVISKRVVDVYQGKAQ